MDNARRRDGDEQKPRQVMRADEDRVDVQRQGQRQHRVHRAGREGDHDVGKPYMGGEADHRDEHGRYQDGDRKRAEPGIDVAEQGRGLHPRETGADQRADADQRDIAEPGRQAAIDQARAVQQAGGEHRAEHPAGWEFDPAQQE
ncbi:hypothetical protein chiPu_0029776 [Chiloscyllium punctatum]|uniref:Uncharacterized protein n=1 Tax=Chiloscyllium punctatum TaxID=137246 RepID=A0A401TSR0_CHIPU|nr:hypothetical protein [Chiloscyllium punctatum]